MVSDRQRPDGFLWYEIHRIIKNTRLTNEMMTGIAARYSDALQPPYERSVDELLKNGYSKIRMEICCSKAMIPFAGENVVENNDPSIELNSRSTKEALNKSSLSALLVK
jgi:hypothetical protein